MNEIVVVKLCTGEIVIGKHTGINPDFIKEAFLVNFAPSHDGRVGIELIPYMFPFQTVGADINIKHSILKIHCPKELENAYIETTTGIIVAPPSKGNPLSIVE